MATEHGDKKKRGVGRPRSKDRHKPGRQVRIRASLIAQVDKSAEKHVTTPPEIVNRYVREGLERDGLWPPKP